MRVKVASSLQQSSRPGNGVVEEGLEVGAVAGDGFPVTDSIGSEVADSD